MEPTAKAMLEFFDTFWGEESGKIYLATQYQGAEWTPVMAKWPGIRPQIVEFVQSNVASGRDVFFAPALFKDDAGDATRGNFKSANARWVDIDGGAPTIEEWPEICKKHQIPEPTHIIQSSVEGRQHVYWVSDSRTNDIDTVQDQNRTLAAILGADRSGWDANQVLRIPGTPNFGYTSRPGVRKDWVHDGRTATVDLIGGSSRLQNGTVLRTLPEGVFSSLASAEREVLENINLGSIPPILDVLALSEWTPDLLKHFRMDQREASESSPNKRSGALQRLAYLAGEAGFSDEYVYSVIADADRRWGKYQDRSQEARNKVYTSILVNVRKKIGYGKLEDLTFAGLLGETPAELEKSENLVWDVVSFVEQDLTASWVIEDMIPEQGIGVFVGQPGAGKSTATLQFCMDVAAGREKSLGYTVGGPKKVLYMSLEMAAPSLSRIVVPQFQHYKEEAVNLRKNLFIYPTGLPLNLAAESSRKLLETLLSDYKPDIVVIDSLSMMVPGNLSDDTQMIQVMQYLQRLRSTYNTSMILVHHDRKKSNEKNSYTPGELSDLFGSQFIAAALDFAIALRVVGDAVVFEERKNRFAPLKPEVVFSRNGYIFKEERNDGINPSREASYANGLGGGNDRVGGNSEQAGRFGL